MNHVSLPILKIILAILESKASSQVNITHEPAQLYNLCPGEGVVITCETRGSPIIAWTINNVEQIEFGSFSHVGSVIQSSKDTATTASLTKNEIQNGIVVLESQLFTSVRSSSQNSSVTCIHVGSGATITRELRVLGMSFPSSSALLINKCGVQIIVMYN